MREPARQPPTESWGSDGPPSVQGWTYPVRPVWIHDLLALWERNKPLIQLLELATDRVAQDVPTASTRQRILFQIASYFVPTTDNGRRSRTASPNPWAAYSQLYGATALAPAYLVNIIDLNELAYAVAWLLHYHYSVGDKVELRAIRRHLVARFNDRPSARAGANSLLRTLAHFEVLTQTISAGEYEYTGRLPVDVAAFPLLMWSWWLARRVSVIRIPDLAQDPLLTFIDHASYTAHWSVYEGSLWALEVHDGVECAVLRCGDEACFVRSMFNLLSAHPKWPTVNRQFPEP
ncbi:MAG: hypothetical protein ACK2UO_07690 [Caldilineaceae bacterium]